MKNALNIIISIIAIIVICKIFVFVLPYIIIGIVAIGLGIWGYIAYTKRKILKKMNEFENQNNKTTYYNTHIKGEERNNNKQNNDYNGPIIDVDYEEVNKK
ncbi:hypothetical protein [Clostridium sp.]|uniref:hypothetical protein n=1 Tax=Clostridium sp. TaxID=1506 RepID=UPI003994D8B4